MPIQLDTVGIVVENMANSLAFYRLAGFAIPNGQDEERNVEFTADNSIMLGFLTQETAQQADPRWQIPTEQRMNLQFRCSSPADVDATHAKLIAAGSAATPTRGMPIGGSVSRVFRTRITTWLISLPICSHCDKPPDIGGLVRNSNRFVFTY